MPPRPAPPPPPEYYIKQDRRELGDATAPLAFAAFIQHHGRAPTDEEIVDIIYSINGYIFTVYPIKNQKETNHGH